MSKLRPFSVVDRRLTCQKKDSALHIAALKGHIEVLKYLVEKGGSVSLLNGKQHIPLHCAAWANQVECVNFLVEKGSDLEAKSKTVSLVEVLFT